MRRAEAAAAWSEEAERALIGSVLIRASAFELVEIDPDELFHPGLRATWRAMCRLRATHKPIDLVSLLEELERMRLGDAVSIAEISACADGVIAPDHVGHYAKIIADHALTRRIHVAVSAALGSGREGEELLGSVFEAVAGISARQTADDSVSMRDLVQTTIQQIGDDADRWRKGERGGVGIPTGLRQLDEAIGGGLDTGVVTIIGGRPSHGKSSLARTIADNASAAGHGVHVFSLEDDRRAYAHRVLADRARMNLSKLRSGQLSPGEMSKLQSAGNAVWRDNWRVDDVAGLSAAQIAMRIRRWRRETNTRLVVVDYVQLMRERGCQNRRAEVEKALLGLANIAREERVALIVLSQLNRDNEKENRRPALRDLRESGELEQVASSVLLVHQERARDSHGKITSVEGEVLVAKNKHGESDTSVTLSWDASCATYRDAEWTSSAYTVGGYAMGG